MEDIVVSEARPSAKKFKRDAQQDERSGNYEAKERRGDLFWDTDCSIAVILKAKDWMVDGMGSPLILRREGFFFDGVSGTVEISRRLLQCFDEQLCTL